MATCRAAAVYRQTRLWLLRDSSSLPLGRRRESVLFPPLSPLTIQQTRPFASTVVGAPLSSLLDDRRDSCSLFSFSINSNTIDSSLSRQLRFKGRHDRHTVPERKPTKKQRKAYHRKLQALQQKQERHSRPGIKAGPRREWEQSVKNDLIQGSDESNQDLLNLDEYEIGDALVDDLMGNSRELSSQATPEPRYLGHKHRTYFNRVADQMDAYRQQQQQLLEASAPQGDSRDQQPQATDLPSTGLPSDRDISLALASYRDRQGTRQKPMGLVKAIQHLVQDLGLPQTAFGELTYTTLLTCCRTPSEGRRCFELMTQQRHAISACSWSILVDIHAKVGDFQGCATVMDEMVAVGGVAPTLPAFTSLLAACYKVCNDGRVPHAIRAEAGRLGWQKWQDMRVIGVDPDVMAYGAMLRLCAARGQPERAINVLEEMRQMDVKPTTLCFSSALKAVARSQAITVRYEKGSSRRHGRREFLTQHHGKMARSVIIMAENAEVEQDEGFVSALILCAAAAGDVATAKAIYVASQLRRMDLLRTIGSDEHLARLRGEYVDDSNSLEASLLASSSSPVERIPFGSGTGGATHLDGKHALVESIHEDSAETIATSGTKQGKYKPPPFGEREYGKDTRALSAILHACAVAADKDGMGTMWQGRENKGFLCENSLRLLAARRVPSYVDNTIPGQGRTDNLTWEGEDRELDFRGNKRKPRKFRGLDFDDSGANLDEIDEVFANIYMDDEGRLKDEFRATTAEDIWRLKYGEDDESNEEPLALAASTGTSSRDIFNKDQRQTTKATESELFFDFDTMKWSSRTNAKEERQDARHQSSGAQTRAPSDDSSDTGNSPTEMFFDYESMRWKLGRIESFPGDKSFARTEDLGLDDVPKEIEESSTEMFFDDDEMRWKPRSAEEGEAAKRTDLEDKILANKAGAGDDSFEMLPEDEEAFQLFFSDLQDEVAESGEAKVTLEEARELYILMKDEFNEAMSMDLEDLELHGLSAMSSTESQGENRHGYNSTDSAYSGTNKQTPVSNGKLFGDMDYHRTSPEQIDDKEMKTRTEALSHSKAQRSLDLDGPGFVRESGAGASRQSVKTVEFDESMWSQITKELGMDMPPDKEMESFFTEVVEQATGDEIVEPDDFYLTELRKVLPTFSEKRLHRVKLVFQSSLSDPSLLDLIPLVRERMPDYITATWLKQMSAMTARFVMYKAAKEDLVDVHMLNGVLELDTAAGSLDRAVEFYETEFHNYKLEPTGYSDRLMVQMFLKNNRLSRALAFKQKLEVKGKTLDIPSYGFLVDFCARRGQLGSAIMLLKECLALHKAPPGEAYISQLRILCRQSGLTDEIQQMVGEDPAHWVRHGEAHLKREMSKRGRRDVQQARNSLVRL